MGSQKPKLMNFPFTFEGFKNDLNIMYHEQCGDSYEAMLKHYQLDGRIRGILEDINASDMTLEVAHELLNQYFTMIKRMLEKCIVADLIHSYAKHIKRNNTNRYINHWAEEVAYIVVWRKHDETADVYGVDVIAAAKAIKDCFSYLKDERVERTIEDMEDCL